MPRRPPPDEFLKLRLDSLANHPIGNDLVTDGLPAFVGKVVSTASNIHVGAFLNVQPISILGQESEGSPGVFSTLVATSVPVYLVGPGTPSTGDMLVCRYVNNRWVAERDSPASGGGTGTTGNLPLCFCGAIPINLTMTSADPSCNFDMFQNDTITYQTIPSNLSSLGLGSMAFLGNGLWTDPLSGASFRYLLTCWYNQFLLTRVFPTSPWGSPFRDAVLYTWFVGSYGNSCAPFQLDLGQAYPGSDASCFVTISES